MHFPRRVLVVMFAVALALIASPAATMARGHAPEPMALTYSGSYPVSVTTQHGNFTGCLTLSASGSALFVSGSQRLSGSYFVVNRTFVATIEAQGYGQNAGLMFIARAGLTLSHGVYEDVYGGSDFDSGALTFGAKGGC